MPLCSSCNKEKPLEEFHKRSTKKGYTSKCMPCHREWFNQYQREWRARQPPEFKEKSRAYDRKRGRRPRTKEEGRAAHLKHKYGLSVEKYEVLLELQGGVCAGCKQAPLEGVHLCVDHDHNCCPVSKTCGKCFRTLLCRKCNYAIELGKSTLQRLIWVLEDNEN